MRIRRYRPSDADAVVTAWEAASRVATPFLDAAFIACERETIRNVWLHEAETWVCETTAGVVGFVSLIGNEVGAIFVRPDCQGQGLGLALMDHAVDLRGDLVLDVFEKNETGRRFYGRYGFEFVKRLLHEPTGQPLLRLQYRSESGGA